MNKYLKEFLLRGMMFGGFGPIVVGIVYIILQKYVDGFTLSGTEVFFSIVSTYILAFLQAGVSVFNQIENWSVPKALLYHFSILYVAYVLCYILNSWIPFKPQVIGIFTAIFVIGYFIVWLTVYFTVKALGKKMNKQLTGK